MCKHYVLLHYVSALPPEGVSMRKHAAYTLYKRVLPSREVVFYYQSYDPDGRRLPGRSTGQSTRSAAKAYCDMLLKEGLLWDGEQTCKIPLFKDYAKGWWDFTTCEYVRNKQEREGGITRTYVRAANSYLRNQILPYFRNMRLDRITDTEIDAWLTMMAKRGLKHTSTTAVMKVLSAMLNYAVKKKYLKYNPCRTVEKLSDDTAEIKILTPREMRALFPEDWSSVWDDYLSYLLCKTAAYTGMRFGELRGVKIDHIYPGYIHVEKQYGEAGYVNVKTKKPRCVTLPAGLEGELRELAEKQGGEYVFTANGRTPVNRGRVYKMLRKALERIGIGEAERQERHLSVHGFRHYFNTYLLANNVADAKVMALTGHLTKAMKERYTHFDFDMTMFEDVRALQERMLGESAPPASPVPSASPAPHPWRGNIIPFRLPDQARQTG